MCSRRYLLPGELLDLPERPAVEQGKAFQCAADERPGIVGAGWPFRGRT